MANQIICPYCGGKIRNKSEDSIQKCPLCSRDFVYAQALRLASVDLDYHQLISLRKELEFSINNENMEKMIKHAEDIISLVSDDYIANYALAYAKRSLGENELYQEFLTGKNTSYVYDDLVYVTRHMLYHYKDEDYNAIRIYLDTLNTDSKNAWDKEVIALHEEHIKQARINKTLEKAKKIDEYVDKKKDEGLVDIPRPDEYVVKMPIYVPLVLLGIFIILVLLTIYVAAVYMPSQQNSLGWVVAITSSLALVVLLTLINVLIRRRK